MATWRYVDFSVKEAQRLADLTSIVVDLETTEIICNLFTKRAQQFEQSKDRETLVLMEALCTAAIVRYGRSFVSGVRQQIPVQVIDQLSKKHQESHVFFMDLRHKWVAHSVNAFECTDVVAYLTPEEKGPKNVSGISARPMRTVSLGIPDMLRLQKLAAAVRGKLNILIKDEEQKVLCFAQSLPPDQFYAKDTPTPKLAEDKDAGKSRRKW